MPDEPTLGELGRRLDDRITDVRDDIAQLGRRIDDKVDTRIFQIQYDALTARVTAIETTRLQDAARIAVTRRWLIGVVIVPLVAVLLPILLSIGGHG
jgi:hypothetical protein